LRSFLYVTTFKTFYVYLGASALSEQTEIQGKKKVFKF